MIKTKRILMVEDETVIQRLVQRLLAKSPYEVDAVDSVRDAADRIDAGAYHLLLTDLRLADGEGAPVIEKFRARFPSSKVIVITGSLMPETLLSGIPVTSLDGCLVKPFEVSDFSSVIARVLAA